MALRELQKFAAESSLDCLQFVNYKEGFFFSLASGPRQQLGVKSSASEVANIYLRRGALPDTMLLVTRSRDYVYSTCRDCRVRSTVWTFQRTTGVTESTPSLPLTVKEMRVEIWEQCSQTEPGVHSQTRCSQLRMPWPMRQEQAAHCNFCRNNHCLEAGSESTCSKGSCRDILAEAFYENDTC
jgi:hypothetical protein